MPQGSRCHVVLFLAIVVTLAASTALAQQAPSDPTQRPGLIFPTTDQAPGATLRVFLDCTRCDLDYLRTELPFVDYVRDRRDAEVHVLVTTQAAGGGTEYTLAFIGVDRFAGTDSTVTYATSQTDTDDEVRRRMAERLAMGLMPYVAGTPAADRIRITYAPERPAMTQPEDDSWNFWVFRLAGDADLSGEQSQKFFLATGTASADRTTEDWKIRFGVTGSFRQDEFELAPGETFTNNTRNWNASWLVIRSLGEHWGAGAGGSALRSTFVNQQLAVRAAPAIEYNVFPYSESTRRNLTLTYAIGLNSFDYEEETIFERMSETLTDETLTLSFDVNEPWGTSSVSLEASHYFEDPSKYHAVAFASLDFRLTRGLSFNVFGSTSATRDQIYLPLRGSTPEEILVRRRQLATNYDYEISFGISYTFGSIFNNVVNSRFAGASGSVIRRY